MPGIKLENLHLQVQIAYPLANQCYCFNSFTFMHLSYVPYVVVWGFLLAFGALKPNATLILK